jgi:hypothetical protein
MPTPLKSFLFFTQKEMATLSTPELVGVIVAVSLVSLAFGTFLWRRRKTSPPLEASGQSGTVSVTNGSTGDAMQAERRSDSAQSNEIKSSSGAPRTSSEAGLTESEQNSETTSSAPATETAYLLAEIRRMTEENQNLASVLEKILETNRIARELIKQGEQITGEQELIEQGEQITGEQELIEQGEQINGSTPLN